MAVPREVGGVAIAFAGFVALTLAFKGTWANVWHALVTGGPARPDKPAAGSSSAPATRPGAGAGSGRPGSPPAPYPFGR